MTILFSRLAAVVLASLTALVIFVPFVTGNARSVLATACGGTSNPDRQEFDIAQAKDIWKEFPAMMEAPELASTDAVCDAQSDGTPNVYENVSKAGAKLP